MVFMGFPPFFGSKIVGGRCCGCSISRCYLFLGRSAHSIDCIVVYVYCCIVYYSVVYCCECQVSQGLSFYKGPFVSTLGSVDSIDRRFGGQSCGGVGPLNSIDLP